MVIVLRSDPRFRSPEANVDPARNRSLALRRDMERAIVGKSSADEGGSAMEPLLLKAGDVAKLLGLGRSKVFGRLAVGGLPGIRVGRSVRGPRAALERWVAEHTQYANSRSEDAGPPLARAEDRD